MYERYEKISCYIWIGLACVGLFLLMWLGFYNHPTGDDYYYGAVTRQVFLETDSVWQVLCAAAKGVVEQYEIWQGTYSAMFLMHLPPQLFHEGGYKLVTTVLLGLYTGSIFYLLKPIWCDVLKGSKYGWCVVSAVYVLLTVETVPFIPESFFWYNGSMYYTGYLSITFFFFGMVIRYLLKGKKYHLPLLCVGAVFLAGGNYVSLLPAILILFTLTVGLFIKRSSKAKCIAIVTVLMILGLLVSAAAPGNQVRGEGSVGNMPAYKAIALSLWQSVSYLRAWLNRWWFMAAIALTPLFWRSYKQLQFTFPVPILVIGFIHGIFCSMSCPTFYAQGNTGPARVVAIVYYGFMLSTLVNYYYLLGYIHRLLQKYRTEKMRYVLPVAAAVTFVVLFGIQIASGELANCSSVKAVGILKSGEAQAYEAEYRSRLAVLEDDAVRDVVFKPYEHQPYMLYVGDFTPDVDNPNNIEIAKYFNKDSIKVDYLD